MLGWTESSLSQREIPSRVAGASAHRPMVGHLALLRYDKLVSQGSDVDPYLAPTSPTSGKPVLGPCREHKLCGIDGDQNLGEQWTSGSITAGG
jgi:hypothetical protein